MSFLLKSPDSSQLTSAARLFSSSVVQELSRKGKSPLFARLARESTLLEFLDPIEPVRNLFDVAFSFLKEKAYRHEYIYKAAITHKLLLGVHSLNTASMLTEFRVEKCKADIAILNGTSTVYEIKSERDKLDRLENQIAAYQKVFAKVNVITGENHLDNILKNTPNNVGVLVLSGKFKISTIRDAQDGADRISPEVVFDSIHKKEAIKILELLNIPVPNVPNTKEHEVLRSLFQKISPITLHACMLRVLKETRSMSPLSELIDSLPTSFQTAALTTSLRRQDHAKLISGINTSITEALTWG